MVSSRAAFLQIVRAFYVGRSRPGMRFFEPISLVYDGQCDFCRRCMRIVGALDAARVLTTYDAHDTKTVEAKFPQLSSADLDESMYAVSARGHVYRGFFAFRRLARSSPLTWPLLPLFYAPGATYVGTRVYAWVARNRRRFGCQLKVESTRPIQTPPPPAKDMSHLNE